MAVHEQPEERPTVRIVSDGTRFGTCVYENDVDITNRVKAIDWHIDVEAGIATAVITFAIVAVDVTALVDEHRIFHVAKHPSFEEAADAG